MIIFLDQTAQGEIVTKFAQHSNAEYDILDVMKHEETLDKYIKESDIVISLLPYSFHPKIAKKCIEFKCNMVTASYMTEALKELDQQAKEAGVTILNEVGLDPGIDHLLAMECFDQVKMNGGKIKSFVSYCGGLPTPENTNNPLLYKFSWNPRGVILNTLSSARYLENGQIKEIPAGQLMDHAVDISFLKGFSLEGYPNRDSVDYKQVYDINDAHTIMRGTLR